MSYLRDFSEMGGRPYPLDAERRRRVMVALAERGATISGMARELGIDQAIASKVICGRRLSAKAERRIAEWLGKPENWLFPPRDAEEISMMRRAEAAARGRAA